MGKTASEKVTELMVVDEFSTQSSTVSNTLDSDSKGITTVIIFVISAILAITLLFVIAIFIDCRQQKLQNLQSKPKRKILKLKFPIPLIGRPALEDQSSILDQIECGEPSTSNVNMV